MENKGESDHFLEILENLENLETVYEQRWVDLATFRAVPASTWGHCPQVLAVLLQFGTLLEKEKLPNGLLPPPAFQRVLMRFTPFTGPENPVKHGENAKVAKSTRVCPPTFRDSSSEKTPFAMTPFSRSRNWVTGMRLQQVQHQSPLPQPPPPLPSQQLRLQRCRRSRATPPRRPTPASHCLRNASVVAPLSGAALSALYPKNLLRLFLRK